MRIDFVCSNYRTWDGYGRWNARLIQALQRAGCEVNPLHYEHANMPEWLKRQVGIEKGTFTISCLPIYFLQNAPSGGRHWLLSMTEGSELPDKPVSWAEIANRRDVERIIVPCEHNADVFRRGGITKPIHVVSGGTDPDEFPVLTGPRPDRPYTFLALADRGARKGWSEVWDAFWRVFAQTPDVRLIIKARPTGNDLLDMIAGAPGLDPRIVIQQEDVADMRQVYAQADCVVIPSRCEGWGMPHREAAMMGLPVITQAYAGLDDGCTVAWSLPILNGQMEDIPGDFEHIKGQWRRCDVDELATEMRWCYEHPEMARRLGSEAAAWLRNHQTWSHSAAALLNLIEEYS